MSKQQRKTLRIDNQILNHIGVKENNIEPD